MNKYHIGDRVWLYHAETRQVSVPCPVCAGTKTVTLILGSGEHVMLPCDYCGKGWESPCGVVSQWMFDSGAEQHAIIRVDTEETATGAKIHYHFANSHYAEEADVYETEAEARAACAEICAELAHDKETRAKYLKAQQAKTYAWNAGYHLREAARKEKEAAYHRSKAAICKTKARIEGREKVAEGRKP